MGVFNSVALLLALAMLSGSLAQQENTTTSRCPAECKCPSTEAESLSCAGTNQTMLPMLLPGNEFTKVDLSYNEIRELDETLAENYQDVTELNLRGNRIEEIPDWMADKFPYLEHLQLSNNKISRFGGGYFINLEKLCLSHNPLELSAVQLNAPQLKTLNMKSCNLTQLTDDVFSEVTELTELNLSDNPLEQPINTKALEVLTSLTVLILPQNVEQATIEELQHAMTSTLLICKGTCADNSNEDNAQQHGHHDGHHTNDSEVFGADHMGPHLINNLENADENNTSSADYGGSINSTEDNSEDEESSSDSTSTTVIEDDVTTDMAIDDLGVGVDETTNGNISGLAGPVMSEEQQEQHTTQAAVTVVEVLNKENRLLQENAAISRDIGEESDLVEMPKEGDVVAGDGEGDAVENEVLKKVDEAADSDLPSEGIRMDTNMDGVTSMNESNSDNKTLAASAGSSTNVVDSALIGVILSVLVLVVVFFVVKKNWPKIKRSMRGNNRREGQNQHQEPLPEEMPLNKV